MALERHLKVSEVSEITGLQIVTIRKKIAARELDAVYFGRAVRIPASAVEKLIAKNLVPARSR